jgi:DNA (cytosine-5)-methyltransferase 1
MTFGSLFAGIGGMDLGLERAGMQCKWQVEIDPFCQKVLTKHWPEVPKYGDIREVNWTDVEAVDLIAGGFPCQDVSSAGHRKGITGPRSGLWAEYFRLICEFRPKYVLVENVAGLLNAGGMQRVLGDLASIGMDAEWESISASHLGAPHHRQRIFILGHANGNGRDAVQVLGNRKTPFKFWDGYSLYRGPDAPGVWPLPYGRVFGVADGLSAGLDGLRGYGNAVVPQVAEWIGRRIMEAYAR